MVGILAFLGMDALDVDSSDLTTSMCSDGGLPIRCQVPNSRGEEICDVEEKYESLTLFTRPWLKPAHHRI